jgi:hypothetical protein
MSAAVSRCLTRVLIDNEHEVAVAQLQLVTQRIQLAVGNIPVAQREYIANALLNLAVARMLSETGARQTAGIPARLGDVVADGRQPPSSYAIEI